MCTTMEKARVYFVRQYCQFTTFFAESVGNDTRTNLPPEENVLTERGMLQAQLLGKHLQNIPFSHIFTSPLARTVSTAQHILSESMVTSVNTEIEKDANIRERHAGIYEGKSTKNLVCGMIAAGANPLDWVPEGGKSKEEVDRILEMFLQKLGALVDSGNDRKVILVVTPGAVLVHLWNYLLRQSDKYMLLNWKPEFFKVSRNTNYFLLDIGKSLAAGGPREMEVLIAHGNDHLKSLGDDALSSFFKEDKSVTALSECMQQ